MNEQTTNQGGQKVKNQTLKINITYQLQKGLWHILNHAISEAKYDIAQKALKVNRFQDLEQVLESIEDATEFIRQIAIRGKGAI